MCVCVCVREREREGEREREREREIRFFMVCLKSNSNRILIITLNYLTRYKNLKTSIRWDTWRKIRL